MRQTPFGVWNERDDAGVDLRFGASMRQTPFGVWNQGIHAFRHSGRHASMRQTPFGVWNLDCVNGIIRVFGGLQ